MSDLGFSPRVAPDLSAKKELADDARDLLDDRAFTQAILQLRRRWFEQLMSTGDRDARMELVAMLKALEAIPTELQTLKNDYTMARRNA